MATFSVPMRSEAVTKEVEALAPGMEQTLLSKREARATLIRNFRREPLSEGLLPLSEVRPKFAPERHPDNSSALLVAQTI